MQSRLEETLSATCLHVENSCCMILLSSSILLFMKKNALCMQNKAVSNKNDN